jgi:hypothetical protein
VISSIKYSGSILKISGVASGSGNLSIYPKRLRKVNHGKVRENELDLESRMLLFGIDHSYQPRHNEVVESDTSRQVFGIE